jgi:DNA binding domain, excisionase family
MAGNIPLTPQEVADILKISKSTVYELIKRKDLNSYRVGKKLRVDMQDVEDYKNKSKDYKPSDLVGNTTIYSPLSVETPVLEGSLEPRKPLVICGQDVILDILSQFLDRCYKGLHTLRSYEGSYNGLYMLYQGEAQVATAHLWDSKTGSYNVPYVERMLPGVPAVIIRLAGRIQGFYVMQANPKAIKGWEDLKRSDITIVNREKGSGTRILLDEKLRILGIGGNYIRGYSRVCPSHLAVASIVARGGADLGLGNEKAAIQVPGIDFIPLQNEKYDMVIKREDLSRPEFETIIRIVQSKEFKMELSGLGGYDLSETGKIIAET